MDLQPWKAEQLAAWCPPFTEPSMCVPASPAQWRVRWWTGAAGAGVSYGAVRPHVQSMTARSLGPGWRSGGVRGVWMMHLRSPGVRTWAWIGWRARCTLTESAAACDGSWMTLDVNQGTSVTPRDAPTDHCPGGICITHEYKVRVISMPWAMEDAILDRSRECINCRQGQIGLNSRDVAGTPLFLCIQFGGPGPPQLSVGQGESVLVDEAVRGVGCRT